MSLFGSPLIGSSQGVFAQDFLESSTLNPIPPLDLSIIFQTNSMLGSGFSPLSPSRQLSGNAFNTRGAPTLEQNFSPIPFGREVSITPVIATIVPYPAAAAGRVTVMAQVVQNVVAATAIASPVARSVSSLNPPSGEFPSRFLALPRTPSPLQLDEEEVDMPDADRNPSTTTAQLSNSSSFTPETTDTSSMVEGAAKTSRKGNKILRGKGKSIQARARRGEINNKFDELSGIVAPGRNKLGKNDILSFAINVIKNLKKENERLQKRHAKQRP